MNRKETIPKPIAQLQRQFEEFRRTRQRRTKLPESLWDAAAELALRLDYMGLKKRLGEGANHRPDKSKPVFVHLIAPPPATREECLIEFESLAGSQMRIHWKSAAAPDWTTLLRPWRDGER